MAQAKRKNAGTQQRRGQQGGSQRSTRQGAKKYGVICRNGESHVLKKMGVSDDNIIGAGALGDLLNRMLAGDTLCVPTISSFSGGAYDLFCKLQFLASRGIEFQSGNEFYLNFSSIKPLSVVTVETLKNFAAREVEFVQWVKNSQLPDAAKVPLINRVQAESLKDLMIVFNNNGIRKKGN